MNTRASQDVRYPLGKHNKFAYISEFKNVQYLSIRKVFSNKQNQTVFSKYGVSMNAEEFKMFINTSDKLQALVGLDTPQNVVYSIGTVAAKLFNTILL